MTEDKYIKQTLLAGVDVGSTTTKIVAVNPESGKIVYSEYRRHNAAQVQSVADALRRLSKEFPDVKLRLCLTGSGSKLIAEQLDVPFIQEVVANSLALREQYHHVRTAIELGGQDAKMIFFKEDENSGILNVADMLMNGSCSGGTGSFIDEVASILKVSAEEFYNLAARGTCVYDISGRCGVYAKTDIQPLLNQGIAKEDLALSAFHAIAKQTIGGLAQGLDIEKPVIFEGGPLSFTPTLIRVFSERLELSEEEAIVPEHPELMVAYGAALSLEQMYAEDTRSFDATNLIKKLSEEQLSLSGSSIGGAKPFFATEEERHAFEKRHAHSSCAWKKPERGEV
ncbi:MAG: activase, partial [Lachnospiraceae bacterium]|nr:activase [Lachnospiraceae bacterium]